MADAVYLWVDGGDPVHQDARRKALGDSLFSSDIAGELRFRSNDELKYSLRSLEMFAPWVNRVFLVTAQGDAPAWLDTTHPQLVRVKHAEIFRDLNHLPTFNSSAIQVHLQRIPNLDTMFLYLDDDLFLGRPLAPETFLRRDGTVQCLSAEWTMETPGPGEALSESALERRFPQAMTTTYSHNLRFSQNLLNQRYGVRSRRVPPHTPIWLHRQVLMDFEQIWAKEVEVTSASVFRKPNNIQFQFALTHYWLEESARRAREGMSRGPYRTEECVFPKPEGLHCSSDYAIVPLGAARTVPTLNRIFEMRPQFFCIQDGDDVPDAHFLALRRLLEAMFPNKSKFEL